MAETLGEAVLELRTSDKGLTRGIDKAKLKAEGLAGEFRKTERAVEGTTRKVPEFADEISQAGREVGRAAGEMGTLHDESFAAASGIDELSRSAGAGVGKIDGLAGSLSKAGGVMAVLATVTINASKEFSNLGDEVEEFSNRFGRSFTPVAKTLEDVKRILLSAGIAGLPLFFERLNDQLSRLTQLQIDEELGADTNALERFVVRAAEALNLIDTRIEAREKVRRQLGALTVEPLVRFELPEEANRDIVDLTGLVFDLEEGMVRAGDTAGDFAEGIGSVGDASERAARRMRDLITRVFPALGEARAIIDDLQFLAEQIAKGGETGEEAARIYEQIVIQYANLGKEADNAAISQDALVDALNRPINVVVTEGVEELGEDVSEQIAHGAEEGFSQINSTFLNVARGFSDALFAAITEGGRAAIEVLGNVLQNVLLNVIDEAIATFIQQIVAARAAAVAGSNGSDASTAVAGGGTTGAATGAATAAVAAAFVLIITDKLVEMLSDPVTFDDVDFAIDQFGVRLATGVESEIINVGHVFEDQFSEFGDRARDSLSKNEELIFTAFSDIFGNLLAMLGATIEEGAEPFLFGITQKWEDGQFIAARVIIDGVTRSFETLEEAIGVVMQDFLNHAIEQGTVFDEAVQQIIQGFQGDPRQFQDALNRVQGLADVARMSLDGLSALEVEMGKIPARAQALANELRNLGLSADQVTRLVGGQLVASFAAMRQQITGEELSVAERRRIAEAQRVLFNAQITLEIARLEAEKQALIASAGIAKEQVKLEGNVIEASARFVEARGTVANAELGVMSGFVSGAGSILRSGVELIGSTSRALGDALGALPEEIRKQVEAIQKVIDALRAIGTIKPGDIQISAPRIGGVGGGRSPGRGGGGDGGAGPTGPSLADQVHSLLDTLFPAEARMREFRENLDLLRRAFEDQIITQERYRESLRRLRETIAASTRDVFERLDQFGKQLAGDPANPIGRRLLLVQREFARAFARARTGDEDAAARFIEIGGELRDLSREAFSSGAGFFGALQDIAEKTSQLEALFGVKLKGILEGSITNTDRSLERVADIIEESREQQQQTTEAVAQLEAETELASVQNQEGHGRTRASVANLNEESERRHDEMVREFKRAADRIAAASRR